MYRKFYLQNFAPLNSRNLFFGQTIFCQNFMKFFIKDNFITKFSQNGEIHFFIVSQILSFLISHVDKFLISPNWKNLLSWPPYAFIYLWQCPSPWPDRLHHHHKHHRSPASSGTPPCRVSIPICTVIQTPIGCSIYYRSPASSGTPPCRVSIPICNTDSYWLQHLLQIPGQLRHTAVPGQYSNM